MSISSQDYVGSYRLLGPIRTGRFTQVWTAIHDAEQRYLAVKLLLPDFRSDPEQHRTMQHELAVGRMIDHPRCLAPYDLRTTQVGPCLFMELVRGGNLREVLKRRREELHRRIRTIVRQAAEGVAYLHSQGLLHLDLKPDNFILGDSGGVRLIDFALARKFLNAWERFFWKQRQVPIQGTRSYLPPEQIRRQIVDVRSDVYSFGCMIYQLVAGVAPYTGASSNELLAKHLYAPIPNVSVDNLDATPELAALLRSMMAKRPGDRPASIVELLPRFETLSYFKSRIDAHDVEVQPISPSRSGMRVETAGRSG